MELSDVTMALAKLASIWWCYLILIMAVLVMFLIGRIIATPFVIKGKPIKGAFIALILASIISASVAFLACFLIPPIGFTIIEATCISALSWLICFVVAFCLYAGDKDLDSERTA